MKIQLKLKNITPLCQIEGNTKERVKHLDNTEIDTVIIKTLTKLVDGIPVEIPIYTANGIRGLLRRVAGSILIEKYLEKGYEIKPTDFHLMMAGGGNNFQTQPFEIEEKVKKLNPVISLFGTSLAIEGKLMVTHLEPEDALIKVYENEENIYAKSQIMKKMIFIKKDDILQHTKFGRFLTKEDIENWEKMVEKTQIQRKKERNDEVNEKKTKKVAIQSILAKYYIVPNVSFKGFISSKYPLSDLEKGLMLSALKRVVNEPLGSTLNWGFGVCDWEIDINDSGSKIIAKSKDNFIFDKQLQLILSDEDEKLVENFNEWLENISPENIEISKVLIAK